MVKLRIGIDPGNDGFICVWRSNIGDFIFFPFPKIGKEVDYLALSKLFDEEITCSANSEQLDIHCVLEQVHAIFGASASSTFSFGEIFGAIKMLLVSHNIPFTLIPPKAWQRVMWQGVEPQKKASSSGKTMVNDTKSMSLMAAKRLFPNVDLRKSDRAKLPDHNKVDSLLLSEFCRRNF